MGVKVYVCEITAGECRGIYVFDFEAGRDAFFHRNAELYGADNVVRWTMCPKLCGPPHNFGYVAFAVMWS